MPRKQAWMDIPMTDDEVRKWLDVREKGFRRFAFRYGAAFTGSCMVLFVLLNFAANAIDGVPDTLRRLPLLLLCGMPVVGPTCAFFMSLFIWDLMTRKYATTIQQREGSDPREDGTND